MPDQAPFLFALLAACFFLATSSRRRRQSSKDRDKDSNPRVLSFLGGMLLTLSALGFGASLGWEIGLAWFILWSGLATVASSLWVSLQPDSTLWIGGLLSVAALATWII